MIHNVQDLPPAFAETASPEEDQACALQTVRPDIIERAEDVYVVNHGE